MKTNLLILFFVYLCCTSCQTDLDKEVSVAQSDNMPEKFFKVDSSLVLSIAVNINSYTGVQTKGVYQQKEIKNIIPYGKGRSLPTMYIVNYQSDGFSIISTDKRVTPILSYSNEGEFSLDDAPEGVTLWLEWVSDGITLYRDQNVQPDPMITSMWNKAECPVEAKMVNCNKPGTSSQIVKGPYLKSTWSQRSGFDKYCPTGCPAGCIPVAAAQLMRYWQHPSAYAWSKMPLDRASDESASLLKILGESKYFDVSYGKDGSSARNAFTDNVLRDLGYNATREKYNYPKVEDNVMYGKPVLLEGKNEVTGIGHTWVCDGIQIFNSTTYSSSYLYMHWGWSGGYCDGYYMLDNWSHKDPATGKLEFDYKPNFLHRMIVDISPK